MSLKPSTPLGKTGTNMADTEEEFRKVIKQALKEGGGFGIARVPKELVIDLVKQYYGLDVIEIKNLNGFIDQNFWVKVSKQHDNPHIKSIWENGYTVNFINTMKSILKGHLGSVHATLLHLRRRGIRTPEPLANLEGSLSQFVNVPLLNEGADADPDSRKKCGMHILTYIPGETLASIENTPETIYQCGETLAKFQNALEDLDNPFLKNKPVFPSLKSFANMKEYLDDLKDEEALQDLDDPTLKDKPPISSMNFVGSMKEYLDVIKDEQKTMLYEIIDDFKSELESKIIDLPKGFIHGDFSDRNILAQAHEEERGRKNYVVDGVLDFEDMQWGEVVWDVGIMLAHVTQMKKLIPPLEAAGIALAGYRSLRTLSEFELSTLKLCIECRLCWLVWTIEFIGKIDPSYADIASSADPEPKYRVLDLLRNMSNADLLQLFDDIELPRQNDHK